MARRPGEFEQSSINRHAGVVWLTIKQGNPMGCPAFSGFAERFVLPIVEISSRAAFKLAVISLVVSFKLTSNEVVFAVHMGAIRDRIRHQIRSVWCAISQEICDRV